jgi:hypothetical protein
MGEENDAKVSGGVGVMDVWMWCQFALRHYDTRRNANGLNQYIKIHSRTIHSFLSFTLSHERRSSPNLQTHLSYSTTTIFAPQASTVHDYDGFFPYTTSRNFISV